MENKLNQKGFMMTFTHEKKNTIYSSEDQKDFCLSIIVSDGKTEGFLGFQSVLLHKGSIVLDSFNGINVDCYSS